MTIKKYTDDIENAKPQLKAFLLRMIAGVHETEEIVQ